jgi:uncharacterized protein (DUF1778 family)
MPTPLSMRFPESDLSVIDRAAATLGRSRTDFVRSAAVEAAEAVLLEHSAVRMSPEDFESFKAILDAPAQVVPALLETLRRKPPWPEG